MKYVITRSDKKTTRAGKPFIRATLENEQGLVHENVSIWSDFPEFSLIKVGDEVEGSVETNSQGFANLRPGQAKRTARTNGALQPKVNQVQAKESRELSIVKSAEDYRGEIIRVAQDRKNESIAYFNATNAAIALVSSMQAKLMSTFNRSVLKHEIDYWRDWFLQEWRKHELTSRMS
jgi:hypothetical protein